MMTTPNAAWLDLARYSAIQTHHLSFHSVLNLVHLSILKVAMRSGGRKLTYYQFIRFRFGHKRACAAEPFCVRQIRMTGATNFQSIRQTVRTLIWAAGLVSPMREIGIDERLIGKRKRDAVRNGPNNYCAILV